MSTRAHRRSDAMQLVTRQLMEIGRELRNARVSAGMRLVDAARAVGVSASTISRVERGLVRRVSHQRLGLMASAVGLRITLSAFPSGRRLLDAPQLSLFARLRARAHAAWQWKTEVPVPISGDDRAADVIAAIPGCRIVIELYVRFANYQAQGRAALLKQRDFRADRLVLVVAGTSANRRAIREAGDALRASFPLGTKAVLRALAEGRDPGANGLALL
jgi:transcriptional regulator with XRE-family HTH domain